ncbi:MAG: fused MFS/spermidine synthase [Candidatus Omnitrophica bacterium]|nr:fused MFS/spermidine synthase [Candidatus Omnitrophota bacterium]
MGVYAFLTPWVWKAMESIYIIFYQAFEPSFLRFGLFKFAIVFVALFVPTFLMGGTLPVVGKYLVHRQKDTAKLIGLLYALNTLGAVLGVFLCGFFLLYLIGVWQTVVFTGVFNLIIFGACYSYARVEGKNFSSEIMNRADQEDEVKSGLSHSQKAQRSLTPTLHPWISYLLSVLFGISGAVSMMYEVGWTRVLAMVLGSSVYAFSTMLVTFLLGISLGSYLFSRFSRRVAVDLMTFSVLQWLTACFVFTGFNVFDDLPYYFGRFYGWFGRSVWALEFVKFLFSSLVMFPPTLCIGAMFACFIHVFQRSDSLGREVGTAYFSNTLGTILGSALTGFLIIPAIGIQATLIAAAVLNVLIGGTVFLIQPQKFYRKRIVWGLSAFLLVIVSASRVQAWDRMAITSGTAIKPMNVANLSKRDFMAYLSEKENLFYREGSNSTVSVDRLRDNISLSVNAKVDASVEDSFTQYLLGHLPMLLHPDPKKVLVIGLGSGSTLAAVASYPVETMDCVEIEQEVIQASTFFTKINRNVLDDRRVRIYTNDGRNFLLIRPDLYDVIISEPSNPWMAGVANLFSYEHYQTMSRRLNPGGIVCQWFHGYSMAPADIQMIVRTFRQVFKDVTLWTSYYPDMMLIGKSEKLVVDFNQIQHKFGLSSVQKDLAPHGIQGPEGLFASFWLGSEELERLSQGAKITSDNHPYLEFSAPRNLYKDMLHGNFVFIGSYRKSLWPAIVNLEPACAKNQKFLNEMARGFIAKRMYQEAQTVLNISREIDANNPGYQEVLGILFYKIDQPQEAANCLSNADTGQPPSSETFYDLGLVLLDKGRHEEAIANFRQALVLAPGHTDYLKGLADALDKAGQYPEALATYDQIVKIKESDFYATMKMAEIIFKIAPLPQQIAISKVLMTVYPRYLPAYIKLGEAYEAQGFNSQAMDVYQFVINRFPKLSTGYLHLSAVYDKISQKDKLKEMVKKAIRMDPSLAKNKEIIKILNS